MVKIFWLGGYVPIHGHSPLSPKNAEEGMSLLI